MASSPSQRAYRQAQLASRQAELALREAAVRAMAAAVNAAATRLTARLARITDPTSAASLEVAERIFRDVYNQLLALAQTTVQEQRAATFAELLRIWETAGLEAAAAVGLTGAALAGVPRPAITMLGAFDSLGGGLNWRTLLRTNAFDAASEANRIWRLGILEGVGPDEMARRMRFYVDGSQPFAALFEAVETPTGDVLRLDLRRVPRELRGQARRMLTNAQRIAVSELHNVRAEAEIEHMARDPLIAAVAWELSPNRGPFAVVPDECDVLASADYYGLGAGIYPTRKVPSPPHPYDKCERRPVTRPVAEMMQQKPNPRRQLAFNRAPVPGSREMGLTMAAVRRAQRLAGQAVILGERAARQARAA